MDESFSYVDFITKINRTRVLEAVKHHGTASRVQLARELTLSKTTVGGIVDDLLEKQILKTVGIASSTKNGGRPASLVCFNDDSAYCIGIDIGGTKLLILITNLAGNIVYELKVPTTNNPAEIIAIIKQSIETAKLSFSKIIGLGIGVPGVVKDSAIVVQASALKWNNLNLKAILQEELSFPIFVENDVNLAAIGERWKGSGDNSKHIIFITLGTGIGGAIIADERLITGFTNRSGEVGFFTERQDYLAGRVNHLNEQGVLEKKISGTALSRHGIPPEELFTLFSRGDDSAAKIINDFILDLAIMISNCVWLLNPERVIIGGGVSESMIPIMPKLTELVDSLTLMRTEVKLATLGNKAGAYGAISLVIGQVEQT
jgi:predicted NBD/HSP70 family sugar kinase